jgi:cytochrome P450
MELFSDDARRDPFPRYQQIRERCPVLHDPQTDLWMIFDYEGAKWALADHDTFSSAMKTAGRGAPDWIIFLDPPRHAKLRGIITRALTPRMVAALEPRIRLLSRELLERAVACGETDLAADFSVPLPMMVIAEMIGIPSGDWPRFRRWSDGILRLSYTISDGEESSAASQEFYAVTAEMQAYLPEMIEQRRGDPQDDLLTRLVEAEVDGARLTDDEIVSFVQLLLVAGNETTTNVINSAVLCLIENPRQLALLRQQPELLGSAIEEVMRYRSPVQWVFRATTREVAIHGQTIPAGKLVLVMIGSANRDPGQFPAADRFDIARDPNAHLAFGHGIHFCLGAPLSRLEAKIALTDLLERVAHFELASSEPWQPRKALHVHGPVSLPIRFEPAGNGRRASSAREEIATRP